MSDVDSDYQQHLTRSERVWNRWSDHYGFQERDTRAIRQQAVDALELEDGDTVIDVGCGPGVNFEMLREAVGSDGYVLAIDYSPDMIEKSLARVDDHGWENVEVIRADATRYDYGEEAFDAALATLSVSVLPDVRAATRTIHRSLVPGGRFAVYDARTVPSGPARVLNPLIRLFFRYFINRNEDEEPLAVLREEFDRVEVIDTYAAGTNYVTIAEKTRRTSRD